VLLEELEHSLLCVVGELKALFALYVSQPFKQARGVAYGVIWLLRVGPSSNRIDHLL
jgi:hypothetical protein